MLKKPIFLALSAILLSMLACRFAEQPIPTKLPTVTPDEKLLAELSPTLTPVGPWRCPVPAGELNQPALLPYGDAPTEVLQFLNRGGGADGLRTAFANQGLLATAENFVEVDFDGDGWLDYAVVLIDFEPEGLSQPGALFIFTCSGEKFTLSYVTSEIPDINAPRIHTSVDLNLDGTTDLLLGRESCGAHTCFEAFEVLMWLDGRVQNRLDGNGDDLPSPELRILQAQGEFAKIEVTARGINSVGAGPFRQFTRVWEWNPNSRFYEALQDRIQPSPFRIHHLRDADAFFEVGDYEFAIPLYQEVIYDDQLDDWLFAEVGREALAAYSKFKLLLTYLLQGAQEDAQETYLWLQASHPEQNPGFAFAQMGEAFWSSFLAQEDFGEAYQQGCLAAQSYAITHPVEILEQLTYGYANRAYTAEDLCPITP